MSDCLTDVLSCDGMTASADDASMKGPNSQESGSARHWGHQRNRGPLCIFLSTSTGEQLHSGHGSATNSGSSSHGLPGHKKKGDLPR